MTQIPSAFRELCRCLICEGVEFLIVGGYAVIIHGYVRTTKDIDLWIGLSPDAARGTLAALDELGYQVPIETITTLQTEHQVLRLAHTPHRVDIMTSCDGCEWSQRGTAA